jgi:hypothetical protein
VVTVSFLHNNGYASGDYTYDITITVQSFPDPVIVDEDDEEVVDAVEESEEAESADAIEETAEESEEEEAAAAE